MLFPVTLLSEPLPCHGVDCHALPHVPPRPCPQHHTDPEQGHSSFSFNYKPSLTWSILAYMQPAVLERLWGGMQFYIINYNNIKSNIRWLCCRQSASSNLLLGGQVFLPSLLLFSLLLAVATWLFVFYSLLPSHALKGSKSITQVAYKQSKYILCC